MPKTTERSAVATPQADSITRPKMTQEEKMLAYLRRYGKLTTYTAISELYIMNPQEIIRRLRHKGFNIYKNPKKSPHGATYYEYVLKEESA